jgi:hypothetical protein
MVVPLGGADQSPPRGLDATKRGAVSSSLSDWSLADMAMERRVGIRLGGGGWVEQVSGMARMPAASA